jgi:hypothetical protein
LGKRPVRVPHLKPYKKRTKIKAFYLPPVKLYLKFLVH